MKKQSPVFYLSIVVAGLALIFTVVVFTHPGIEKQTWARVFSLGLLIAWLGIMIFRRRMCQNQENSD